MILQRLKFLPRISKLSTVGCLSRSGDPPTEWSCYVIVQA